MTLPRRSESVSTDWGEIEGVLTELPDGTERFSPEYAHCQRIADKQNVPLAEVYTAARRSFGSKRGK